MITEQILSSINYFVVFGAAVANFLVAGLWYSPLILGKNWVKEMNLKETELKKIRSINTYASALVYALLSSFFLAILFKVLGPTVDGFTGAHIGLFISIGFVATSLLTNFRFENRSPELMWISVGHHMVTFMVMGAIIGAFQN